MRYLSLIIALCLCCFAYKGLAQDFIILPSGEKMEGEIVDKHRRSLIFLADGQKDAQVFNINTLKEYQYDYSAYYKHNFIVGLTVGSPVVTVVGGLSDLLDEEGFGGDISSFWGSLDFPQKSISPAFSISMAKAFATKKELGLITNFVFANTTGSTGAYLSPRPKFSYSDITLSPIYRKRSKDFISFYELGPSLGLLNIKTKLDDVTMATNTIFSPGITIGGGAFLSKRPQNRLLLKFSYTRFLSGISKEKLINNLHDGNTTRTSDEHIPYQSLLITFGIQFY